MIDGVTQTAIGTGTESGKSPRWENPREANLSGFSWTARRPAYCDGHGCGRLKGLNTRFRSIWHPVARVDGRGGSRHTSKIKMKITIRKRIKSRIKSKCLSRKSRRGGIRAHQVWVRFVERNSFRFSGCWVEIPRNEFRSTTSSMPPRSGAARLVGQTLRH
jgi:hypothetical protein